MGLELTDCGHYILSAIDECQTAEGLHQIESVNILRQVWIQQYTFVEGQLVWRQSHTTGVPANKLSIESPYDPEARNRTKRDTNWTGYSVHLTETCDEDTPNLITHVETTQATTPDGALTQKIHASLATIDLLPKEHLLDTAYVDAQHLVTCVCDYEITLVGRVPPDTSWQAHSQEGFDISCFNVDWVHQQVRCPQGHLSRSWRPRSDDYGNRVIEVHFERAVCAACPARKQCTRDKNNPRLSQTSTQRTIPGIERSASLSSY